MMIGTMANAADLPVEFTKLDNNMRGLVKLPFSENVYGSMVLDGITIEIVLQRLDWPHLTGYTNVAGQVTQFDWEYVETQVGKRRVLSQPVPTVDIVNGVSISPQTFSVPEPSTGILGVLLIAGLAFLRRM